MKYIVIILAIVSIVLAAGCTSTTNSVDNSNPAAAASNNDDHIASEAARGYDLSMEAKNLMEDIVDWANAGANDPLGACVQLDDMHMKMDRIDEILDEIDTLDVPNLPDTSPVRDQVAKIESLFSGVDNVCSSMGY